ncbi:MAG TPA: hypothetical protein PLT16_12910, partial [Daejeonella sp.]|nr:hypothetical protein [Daejeonella sp.]
MKKVSPLLYSIHVFFVLMFSFILIGSNQTFAQNNNKNQGINIGSKRQLFVDNYLIQTISGKAELKLHNPVPR